MLREEGASRSEVRKKFQIKFFAHSMGFGATSLRLIFENEVEIDLNLGEFDRHLNLTETYISIGFYTYDSNKKNAIINEELPYLNFERIWFSKDFKEIRFITANEFKEILSFELNQPFDGRNLVEENIGTVQFISAFEEMEQYIPNGKLIIVENFDPIREVFWGKTAEEIYSLLQPVIEESTDHKVRVIIGKQTHISESALNYRSVITVGRVWHRPVVVVSAETPIDLVDAAGGLLTLGLRQDHPIFDLVQVYGFGDDNEPETIH